MYQYTPMQTIIKAVLNVGTIIVLLMAHEWLKREDTRIKQGEFYVLTLSTLLGMYFMISAGHFPDVLHRIGNGKYPDGRTGGIR